MPVHTIEYMSEAEHPDRATPGRTVTVEDIRQLVGASTPHFALQVRNRIAQLIRGLSPDDSARIEGEREMARLRLLGMTGETRGQEGEEGLPPLPSLSAAPDAIASGTLHG
jgi:hypothetical protein